MRKKRGNGGGRNPSTGAMDTTPMSVAGQIIGLPNIGRRFVISDDSNPAHSYGPHVYLLGVQPLSAFFRGYNVKNPETEDDVYLDNNFGDILDTTLDDANTTVYPVTEYAYLFDRNIYPHILTLTQQQLGARYAGFTRNRLLRQLAMTGMAYAYVFYVLQLNKIVYSFDWSKIPPFTTEMPPFLWKLLDQFGANTVDLARIWVPLMQRIENRLLPPAFIAQIRRALTPFVVWGPAPALVIPYPRYQNTSPWNLTPPESTPTSGMWNYHPTQWLEYMDENLSELYNLLASFYPFPVIGAQPWTPTGMVDDPPRAMALANITAREFYVYTNEGSSLSQNQWPALDEHMRFARDGTSGDYLNAWMYASTDLIWDMFQWTGAYVVGGSKRSLIAADSRLFTPHQSSHIHAFSDIWTGKDDEDNVVNFIGYENFSDVHARYYYSALPLAGRFRAADDYDIGRGFVLPSTLASEIPYEVGETMMRRQVESDWNYPELTQLHVDAFGSANRTRKRSVDEIAAQAYRNAGR